MGLPVREILKLGERRLTDSACGNPKTDSELLYCHLMNIDRGHLFMHWSDELSDECCNTYFGLLDSRTSGAPLQYITGKQSFMGIDFAVDENVLIPRQETEMLVEAVLETVKASKGKIKRVLDLCTGSGAIAVSLAALTRGLHVTASDISNEAVALARKNASDAAVKVDFTVGDLFAPFKKAFSRTEKFDLIVSNPPYIRSSVIPTLQVEVREHEPMRALDGGEDGLDFYRRIIAQAPDYLRKNGIVALEIGHDQAQAIGDLAADSGAYARAEIIRDLAGLDRVMVLYTAQ